MLYITFDEYKNNKNKIYIYIKNKTRKTSRKKQIKNIKSINNNSNIKIISKNNNINKSNDEKKEKKEKNLSEYIDEEINELSYNLALKYDKRIYCEYYTSLIKTKHK